MKNTSTLWRKAMPTWQLIAVTWLISASAIGVMAQAPSPTPQDKRGLGIESSAANAPQNDQTKTKEARPELVLQTGYNNFFGATRLVFSPDGRLLATGTFRSSTIKLWETTTGRELRNISTGGQNAMSLSTVFAFSPDSHLLAAAAGGNAVKIYDVISGREIQTLTTGQASFIASFGVTFIAFSADGKKLVTVSDAIKVWEVASWRELKTLDTTSLTASGLTGGEGGMALSADGNQLARADDASKTEIKVIDLVTGREARAVSLPHDQIDSLELCFTTDGRLVAAGIVEKKLKVWDVTNKQTERDLTPTTQEFSQIKFSRDGRLLALSEGYTIKLWDLTAGRELPSLSVPNLGVFTQYGGAFVSFSADGKKLATGGFGTPTLLWETETGKQLLPLKGRSNMAYAVAFSADGTQLSAGGRTRWDLRTGRGLRITPAPSDKLFGMPAPDGKSIAMFAPNNNAITILETTTGRQLQTLARSANGGGVDRVSFSPDGHLLAARYLEEQGTQNPQTIGGLPSSQVKIWDVASGREVQTLTLATSPSEVSFTADGRALLTVGGQGEVVLWDIASGNRLRSFAPTATATPATTPGLPPGMGSLPNLGSLPNKGKPGSMPTFPNMPTNMADMSSMITNMMGTMSAGTMGKTVTSVAFSPDGRTLATGGVESKSNFDMATMISNAQKGSKSKKQSDPQDFLKDLKVETTGQVLFFDVATGREAGAIKGHGKGVTYVAFSRDGKLLATSATDNTIKIWDLASKRELRTLSGHTSNIESMDFSPDGRLLASAGEDGSTFLWDANTGEHLLTLVSLDDGGEWIVVTPEGLFDGTPSSWNQILWRYNQDTFNVAPIEWFFNEFYYPGLLADVFAGKRPHVAQDVSKKDRRQPIVKLSVAGESPANGIAARTVKVRVDITDAAADKDHAQGSGARDVRLFRNGSLVKVWHGDALKGQAAATLEEEVTVVAGANRLTAYSFNRDNVKSKDANLLLTGADSLKRAGTAWVIAVGINEYANTQYNLKYAVADAQSFAEELRVRQTQIGRFERVEVIPLLNENATKANILSALRRLAGTSTAAAPTLKAGLFDRLRRAEPEDAVIIYFAGHGTAQGQRFYLIPHDLGYTGERGSLDDSGLKAILSHSISDLELEESVEGLPAGSLLMVIDACNSGQALEAEEKRRGPMNSKGLAQLAYEKGMYILTAAQSYQAALEAAQFGHGLLTYALVEEGLKTAAADNDKDGVLSAREWLDFATERVPQMQEEKMKQARGLGVDIAFTEGEKNVADPEKRSVQRPRVFYRREMETEPLVIAKPGSRP